MTKTFAGKIGKALSVLVASALLLVSALMLSACSGKYPEISMRISFNGEEYTLNYILYRNYYQQTVDHYMELIDMDYFDGTVISDYQSDRMVAGGYRYEGENTDELIALDYEAATKDADGSVTLENITVWKDADRNEATNRLHGETSVNGFSVSEGGLNNKFGVLGTYSYVPTGEKTTVTFKQSSKDDYGHSEYYKNSTTSMAVPWKKVGTVQNTMAVMHKSGAMRISQGRNLPLGFLFFAYIRSIKIPISGSLTASQMFQIKSRAARTAVFTCSTLV